MIAGDIKPVYLENYQEDREGKGRAAATIDMEMTIAKSMVIKAFDNDKLDGRVLKAFRSVKRKLKKGSNARKRTLSFDEYVRLIDKSPQHLKACIIIAYNTGMRTGELRLLKWSYVDKSKRLIKLPAKVTKEGRPKKYRSTIMFKKHWIRFQGLLDMIMYLHTRVSQSQPLEA